MSSSVFVLGNKGIPVASSASTHASAHISAASVNTCPNINSGARFYILDPVFSAILLYEDSP